VKIAIHAVAIVVVMVILSVVVVVDLLVVTAVPAAVDTIAVSGVVAGAAAVVVDGGGGVTVCCSCYSCPSGCLSIVGRGFLFKSSYYLHPGRLTWNLQITMFFRRKMIKTKPP